MSSTNVPLINHTPPPRNAHLFEQYNQLVEACWKRGFGFELTKKEQGEAILQSDLSSIRAQIKIAAEELFLDPEKPVLTSPYPFECVKINEEKGFLIMPGEYTSTRRPVYNEEPTTENEDYNIPVLWEHFKDLQDILNTLTHRKCDFDLTMTLRKDDMQLISNFMRGALDGTPTNLVSYDAKKGIRDEDWTIQYKVSERDALPEQPQKLYYAKRLDGIFCESWFEADCGDELTIEVEKIASKLYALPNVPPWEEEYYILPVYVIEDKVALTEYIPEQDNLKNGVAKTGCDGCCDIGADPITLLLAILKDFASNIKLPLALSSPGCSDIQIAHYICTYTYAGEKWGQYNCDTHIEERYGATMEDEAKGQASWRFRFLRRPSGLLIPFYQTNWSTGEAVPLPQFNVDYTMQIRGAEEYVTFEDGIIQRFFADELLSCATTSSPALQVPLHGKNIEVDGKFPFYEFTYLGFRTTRVTVNKNAVPISHSYTFLNAWQLSPIFHRMASAALRSEPSTDEQQSDQVHRITFSEDASELEGYDFADFFAPGEAPSFDQWQAIGSSSFFNADEQLFAKYIQLDFEDGASARGYWRKHGSDLLPTQLTIFRQEDSGTGEAEFMETVTTIKFDSSRERFESQTRSLKKSFPFGDETIAEYKNYGTANQLETRYEYGTDYDAGSYGQLVASTDFNGSWARYEYDSAGRPVKTVTPFMDAPADAPENQCNVTVYDYEPLHPDETVLLSDSRTRTIIRYTLGVETARSYHLYFEDQNWSVTAAAPGAPYDAAGNIVNKTFRYTSGTWAGCTWRTENADGSSSLTTYEEINPVIDEEGNILHDTRITTLSGRLPGHGTREVVINNYADHVISRETYDLETGLLIGGSTYEYNEFGKMTKETTIDGDVTSYVYNCCGPRFVTAPDGSVTEYGYDAFNRQVFSTAAGITTMRYYDADDNILESVVIGKEGGELVTHYEYNADGELIREINPAGAVTEYENGVNYSKTTDALGGTVISTRYLDGSPKSTHGTAAYPRSYKYGIENGEPYALECAAGIEQRRTYTDFLGRSYKTVYPDNFTETTVYDNSGRVVGKENSGDFKAIQVYDENSGAVKYQAIKRSNSSNDIDWNNDLITETDSGYSEKNSNTVVRFLKKYVYNNGSPVEVSLSEASRDSKLQWETKNGLTVFTELSYEGDGKAREITTSYDGTCLTNSYENDTLKKRVHNSLGEIEYIYDEFNRPTGTNHQENGIAVNMRTAYNKSGQPITTSQTAGALQKSESYEYDLLGRASSFVSASGDITTYSYDQRSRVVCVENNVLRQEFDFDDLGNLSHFITYQDERTPQITSFLYDNHGRPVSKIYSDNNRESYKYQGDGKISEYTSCRGHVHHYSYNAAGELIRVFSEAGLNRTYRYDQKGQLIKVTDNGNEMDLSYGEYGNLLSETFPLQSGGKSVTHSYDSFYRPIGLGIGNLPVAEYEYGSDNRLSAVGNQFAKGNYAYVSDSEKLQARSWQIDDSAPFLTMRNAYDDGIRFSGLTVNNQREVNYSLNIEDRKTSAEMFDGSKWNYSYDNSGQLTHALRHENDAELNQMSYTYNRLGNRLSSEEDSIARLYTSNQLNQYMLVDMDGISYDADGNMLMNRGWLYTWDTLNRLVKAEKDHLTLEFDYDYMGRRSEKKVSENGVLIKHERFIYSGYKLIGVFDAMDNDRQIFTFVWQPESVGKDVLLSMVYDGNGYYYITDGNKNITGLMDSAGNRVASYIYGPFGNILEKSGEMADANPFRFSTEYHDDETTLIYYNYRYYDNTLGYWLSRDPLAENGSSNLYNFVNNNPINYIDPLGLVLFAFDGTNNTPKDFTNVYIMSEMYVGHVFYYKGVGNEDEYRNDRFAALAFAVEAVENKIRDARRDYWEYFNTSKRYDQWKYFNNPKRENECIDVIGFSRGAVTAVGFVQSIESKMPGLGRNDKVRFLGLFDPVPGPYVKVPEIIPGNVNKTFILYSRDERRAAFLPSFYTGGNYNHSTDSLIIRGGHADIGGGYKERGLANYALSHMLIQARRTGAPFNDNRNARDIWGKMLGSGHTNETLWHQEYYIPGTRIRYGLVKERFFPTNMKVDTWFAENSGGPGITLCINGTDLNRYEFPWSI